MRITADTVLTKADLEMAVFLSRGEVDRYRIMLEHDIRAYELMNPESAEADTVILARSGLVDEDGSARPDLKHLAKGYKFPDELEVRAKWQFFSQLPADDSGECDDVITHDDVSEARTDQTGTLYRAPVV